jgi:hypothetical protein
MPIPPSVEYVAGDDDEEILNAILVGECPIYGKNAGKKDQK